MKTLLKFIGLALLVFTFSFTNVNKKTIVIDVAHGGEDHGCVHESHIEKEIVASIANKIIDLNQNPNTNIVLTREADKFISLDERAKMINNLNPELDRKSTRLNSSHVRISYAVFCLKKKK